MGRAMATLGFTWSDFDVFKVEGFSERMGEIYARIRPRLIRLGDEIAPELARKLHLEVFPHVARHARHTVNPPPETWCAFGPSARGYKRFGYLALCISGAGIHARAVVKSEADNRAQMAAAIRRKAAELSRSLKGTRIGRYDGWDSVNLPAEVVASDEFWNDRALALDKKTGGLDVGFGWKARDAIWLDRGELLDAFRELEPLYRICRAVA